MVMLNNNLRIFIAAAELESVTEAAKKLYISQPAISQAIKKLEDELSVKLFIRSKRSSLKLTEVGKDILALAYKMADLENRLYQIAYDVNHLTGGTVRIASVPLGVSLIISHVLPEFKKRYPHVQVKLLEGNPLEVKSMVLNYQADLGISTSPYMGLAHKILLSDRMVSINKDKALSLNLKDCSSELLLCRVAYESISEQLSGCDIDLSHSFVVEAASTQINMVQEGNGPGIISELMLSTIPNKLACGTVEPNIEMEISLVAHNFADMPNAAKEMAKAILDNTSIKNK